jgi:hypothetical protein
MDTKNTPYSIKKPIDWDLISEFSNGGKKPDSVIAQKAFDQLLENIKIANCDYFEDVCNAILTRIPAKIEAENYGFDGFNQSYFVTDTIAKSKYYRKGDPVKINLDSKDKDALWSEQSIELKPSEWVVYDFENIDNQKHTLTIRALTAANATKVIFWVNEKKIKITLTNKSFYELLQGDFELNKGLNKVKVMVESGVLQLDWVKFD